MTVTSLYELVLRYLEGFSELSGFLALPLALEIHPDLGDFENYYRVNDHRVWTEQSPVYRVLRRGRGNAIG